MADVPGIRPRRSALYTPPGSVKLVRNALLSAADVVIFDLEDAIAPTAKARARDVLFEGLAGSASSGASSKERVVRVNGLRTPWIRADLDLVQQLDVQGILFPKIETAEDVRAATEHLQRWPERDARSDVVPALWCMIETPLAVLNARAIAAVTGEPQAVPQVWVAGTNDLRKGLRARAVGGGDTLEPYLAMMLLAARAYGIDLLDGVHNDFRDLDGLGVACERAAAMGFDGKTVIHPSQIPACNQWFSPGQAELDRCRAIVAAFSRPENADTGVVVVDGSMVELLHAEMARRTIALAQAIADAGEQRVSRPPLNE
jgi:citrate lyase subunit beta/citryl-CoA lyase